MFNRTLLETTPLSEGSPAVSTQRVPGSSVTPVAQVAINDLPLVIDRPEEVVPAFRDLEIRFIDPPPATNSGPERLGCRDEARGTGSDPIVDGTRVDGKAPLSQPLHDIGVAEAIAQLPAHGERKHLVREAVPAEG
ncbi:MAG TPA: hypothetical protein VGW38_27895 [Chloroflexota bacterium]|nr:hypothetical protein [Chloroflexota bacterium]